MLFTMIKIVMLLVLLVSRLSYAAVEVQGGGGTCAPLLGTLKTNWSDVRNHMVPTGGKLKTPKREDFVCVNRYAVRQAIEKRVISDRGLRCFSTTLSSGLGICCDSSLNYCARLNPGLFPDLYEKQRKDKPYEPPKSKWVRPPSDGEQWQSN